MASCPAQSSSSAFFVTVGRGLENFAADEIRAKLLASPVEVIDGKVFFCANVTKDKLFSLKMAERAFVLVKKINSVRLPYHKVSGFRLLCKLALEDVLSWNDAVRVWKRFQVSAEPSLSHVRQDGAEICSHAADAPRKCKSTAFSEDVSATKLRAGNEDTLLHCDAEEEAFQTDPVDLAQQRPPADIFPELLKENLSFRVSFRCSGRNSRRYNPQELGCQLGLALTREFGWKADLRKPQLEVIAHLNNEAFIVGFPLTRVSLANRSWCRSPGLRATVAHAVAVLAGVQSGAKVLDPMCGSGTILLEATMEWKSAYYIGADIDCSQLSSASRNIASSKQSIDLIKASVLALPLQSSSVDVIVCDMPFGRRFGRGNDIMSQTRSSLQEMIRVLVSSGILVLLVSQTMSQEVIKMVEDGKCCQYKTQINNALVDITKWPGHARKCKPDERACGEDASRTVYVLSLQEVVPVSLGETEASIHKYIKIRHGEKRTS